MAIDVVLTTKCEACDVLVPINHTWNAGVIVPQPSQIRIQLLEWSEEVKNLIDIKLQPDVSCLFLCENCRAEMMAEIIAALLRLRDKQPEAKHGEVIH